MSSIYNLAHETPSTPSTFSLDSTTSSASSISESILALYPTSNFASPPSGPALPLPGTRPQRRLVSFSERRGHCFNIQIDAAKPLGEATAAKGPLEPRAGSLPRRRSQRKQQSKIAYPALSSVTIDESRTFLF
ncbi:hypothetical protein L218DRAFT_465782 [Marasmius fiardii PR-910]|nr:hypothetical protein L218DRAFT_465782 [Marasmius fiardii PR-910]